MRRLSHITFLLLLSISSPIFGQDFSSPEATFNSLLVAIETEDLDLYKECWDPETLEKEGMYSRLEQSIERWAELQGIFKGPQEIDSEDFFDDENGNSFYKGHVSAPEAEGGGIGTFMMKEIKGFWRMHRW